MDTTLYGTGNVAWHLAKALGDSVWITGRNQKEAGEIAKQTGARFSAEIKKGLVILCVQDQAIPEVSRSLSLDPNSLVVHTSGSVPMTALETRARKGCLYPMQTFSRGIAIDYAQIPFFVEAENAEDEALLLEFAKRISPRVMRCSSEKRKYVHLTAVFACNFVNHLYDRAGAIAAAQGIPFDYFMPLMRQTLEKTEHLPAHQAQTGPARRGDLEILKRQAALLEGKDREIYQVLSRSILQEFHPELSNPFEPKNP